MSSIICVLLSWLKWNCSAIRKSRMGQKEGHLTEFCPIGFSLKSGVLVQKLEQNTGSDLLRYVCLSLMLRLDRMLKGLVIQG